MRPWLAAFVAAVAAFALPSLAEAAYPIHAIVVASTPDGLVVRTAGATGILAAGTYRFRSGARFAPGTSIDGLVEPSRRRLPGLLDAVAAPEFVPGLPSSVQEHVVQAGDALPDATLVDQRGTPVRLSQWRGKTLVLSFIYTRCPLANVCPAVSGKFAYLQRQFDPAHTHLAIVTLDPTFDSPSVLARYGVGYGADVRRWSLLTGEGNQVKKLLDAFRISPLEDGPGDFIHEEALVIVDPRGTIREIIPTPGWDPSGVIAEVRSIEGRASNPIARLALAAVAGIAVLCGGYSVAGVLLILFSALLTFIVAGIAVGWLVWRIMAGER